MGDRFTGQASPLRKPKKTQSETPDTSEIKEEVTIKVYGEISESLYEKFLDYCFWEHETQGETVAEALEQFLSDKVRTSNLVRKRLKTGSGRGGLERNE